MVGGSFLGIAAPTGACVLPALGLFRPLPPRKQQLLPGGGESFEGGLGSGKEPALISKCWETFVLPLLLLLSLSLSLQDHVHC